MMSQWNQLSYQWDEVSNIPSVAGIYAWYFMPKLRKADLVDAGLTKNNLAQIADILELPEMEIVADGHLSLKFRGKLFHESIGIESEFSDLVNCIIESQESRRGFASILELSAPFFSSPLYIGVSNNLKTRISIHKNKILNKDFDDGHCFAREVCKREIPLSQLVVFVFFNSEFFDNNRKIYEAVETILNRLYYPIFGRR